MSKFLLLLLTICFCLASSGFAQQLDSAMGKIASFPNRFFAKIQNKAAGLDLALTRQTEKYLQRMAKKEKKLQARLYKKDSVAAKNLFAGVQERYLVLEQKIRSVNLDSRPMSGEYLPYIDSLKGSLNFLQKNQNLLNTTPDIQNKIAGSLAGFNQLQSKLQISEEIKSFVQQRKQTLGNVFAQYSKAYAQKYIDAYDRQSYYYCQQVKEYQDMLNEPDRMEEQALNLLGKLPAFEDFMKKNSMLASLLNLPATSGTPASAIGQGLPSRDQVLAAFQGQAGMATTNPSALLQQNLGSATGQVDQLRDKLSSLGSSGTDLDMPGFQPNSQKTKSFLKRLELGSNIQTVQTSYFYPAITDIGLSLGYRLSKNSTIGLGGSYKIGWGTGFNHISITSQGASIRSFIDIRAKGNLFISGGYEENYQKPFANFQQIRSLKDWTSSGLIGLSKMIAFKAGLVKNTKVSLLWDFLSYYQLPKTQPLLFRVGYSF